MEEGGWGETDVAARRKEIIKHGPEGAGMQPGGITNNRGTCKQFEGCVEKWF